MYSISTGSIYNFINKFSKEIETQISAISTAIAESKIDLRKCKNRQKIAGGFRTFAGQTMYCKILSVIETAKRHKVCAFETIKDIIADKLVRL